MQLGTTLSTDVLRWRCCYCKRVTTNHDLSDLRRDWDQVDKTGRATYSVYSTKE